MRTKALQQLVAMSLSLALLAVETGCSTFGGGQKSVPAVNDGLIETRIREELSREPLLRGNTVQVRSEIGIVELTGRVPSMEVKSRAGLVAAAIPGVVQVHNDLLVNSTGSK
jgi:hyperosmotically inducible protein